jgi:diphthamide synthase (EF-2-diphthine--ammonia ligase)
MSGFDKSFVGSDRRAFINDLTRKCRCMYENGEFHTLLLMYPFSKHHFEIGEVVYRKHERPERRFSDTACDSSASDIFRLWFWYCDLIEK